MSSWLWLSNVSFLICLINIAPLVKSQFPTQVFIHYKCENGDTFLSNSTYKSNLDTLLGSISTNIDSNGFYNASVGVDPNRINVIALCRADLQPYQCRNYMADTVTRILDLCRGEKQAVLWHEFCMVRYSDKPIFGTLALMPNTSAKSGENVSNSDVFYWELNVLLESVREHAAFNSSPKRFAGAIRDVPNYRTVYAFEQCTPDINPKECADCLTKSAQQIRECCEGARGVRILTPSCYLRFETDPFYNESMVEKIYQPPTRPMPPPPQPPGKRKNNNSTRTIIIIVVTVAVGLILSLCIFIYLKTKRSRKAWDLEFDSGISTIESLQYDFGTIRDATNNFSDSNKLGHGGFGIVYKGKLRKGNEIAVKRLSRGSEQGDQEFKNEVLLVARLQHRNLVRLLGFSVERDERLLIYEYVQNGSLDGFIFDPKKHPPMDWEKRYTIIGGVAKGLLYLHEDSRLTIIHRDLKASNILLDGEMNPKISDFGMARLFVPNETQHGTSRIVGTYGYMAPEYVLHGQCSTKSDVYSFGVLVLEIVTGEKIVQFQKSDSMDDLLSCVWKKWQQGTVVEIIDSTLRAASGLQLQNILRCIHIGLLCVQENAVDRPTMGSVVLMLSSLSLTLPVPSQPAFFTSERVSLGIQALHRENIPSNDQPDNATNLSTNEVSMSELHPR